MKRHTRHEAPASACAVALAFLLALSVSGCATTPHPAVSSTSHPPPPAGREGFVSSTLSQPFRDLGMVNRPTPPALARAVAAPYATSSPPDCAAMAAEVAELDAVLGADIDAGGGRGGDADMILDLARGAVGLPYRGVVRQISGAARRDRAYARAVMAGMVRRGFLKGLVLAGNCAHEGASP